MTGKLYRERLLKTMGTAVDRRDRKASDAASACEPVARWELARWPGQPGEAIFSQFSGRQKSGGFHIQPLQRRNIVMRIAAEREIAHIGESQGAADHDHDMIHELSKRLDAVWRFDQYIANAEGHPELQTFWRQLKAQEKQNVDRLKEMVAEHCREHCF